MRYPQSIIFVQYKGHTIVHTQQFTLSNVISYLFFKAQACSGTIVVDDAKIVSKFLPSSITSTHVPTVELFIKCFMTHKTTGIEDRHRCTGMLMTTILLVLLGPHFTQDLRSCATRLLLSFAHSCFFMILPQFAWNTVKPNSIQIREVSKLAIYCKRRLFN